MEAFLWQRLTEWETGSCSDGWSHVAHQNGIKSLIQFSVDGLGWVPSLLFHLRPNYGGGDEDNGDLLQKVLCVPCRTQCPRPCSRPPPTHASTRDAWTLTGKSGSVSCGSLLLSPGSWYAQGSVCALQESVSQSRVSSSTSMVGIMVTSSKRAYAITKSSAPRLPFPGTVHC